MIPFSEKEVTVVDEFGFALPAVNIVWADNAGTITNSKGQAVVKATSSDQNIRFSYVGFQTRAIPFNQLPDQVVLSQRLEQLPEVLISTAKKTPWHVYASIGLTVLGLYLSLKDSETPSKVIPVKPKKVKI